jgi:hypothetical protein
LGVLENGPDDLVEASVQPAIPEVEGGKGEVREGSRIEEGGRHQVTPYLMSTSRTASFPGKSNL